MTIIPAAETEKAAQTDLDEDHTQPQKEEFLDFDPAAISKGLEQQKKEDPQSSADQMENEAHRINEEYESQLQQQAQNSSQQNLPLEVSDKMPIIRMEPEFAEEAQALRLPQFYITVPKSIFIDGNEELLDKTALSKGFSLNGKPTDIDFSNVDSQMVLVDVKGDSGNIPKALKMSTEEQRYFKELLSRLPAQGRKNQLRDLIYNQVKKIDTIDDGSLRRYIKIVIENLSDEQLAFIEEHTHICALKIKEKIDRLLEEHSIQQFHQWIETGKIICRESYPFPETIHPASSSSTIGKSLYTSEETMNGLEQELVMELTALDNVKWWHRNISKQGFFINGFINHYPDLIIMTRQGHIVLAEAKGGHLKNDDSRQKAILGRAWEKAAGSRYRYYMVFRDTDTWEDGAISMSAFLAIMKEL